MQLLDPNASPHAPLPRPPVAGIGLKRTRCPYCHDAILPAQVKLPCLSCMAWHHRECAEAHARCAACGEAVTPELNPPTPRPPSRPNKLRQRAPRRSVPLNEAVRPSARHILARQLALPAIVGLALSLGLLLDHEPVAGRTRWAIPVEYAPYFGVGLLAITLFSLWVASERARRPPR